MKNLRELSHNPSPYVLPVIPRPLPLEVEEGEHYVISDLLNLAPGSSFPAQTSETEVVGWELVISLLPEQPSSDREDSGPTPQYPRRLIGLTVSRVFLLQKRILVLPLSVKEGRRVPERWRTPGAGVCSLGFPHI